MKCKAVQYSDQYVCNECGFIWDMNDPDPPECKDHVLDNKPPPPNEDEGI